jgi:hypothetical protein
MHKFPRLDDDVATERWVLFSAAFVIVAFVFAPYLAPVAICLITCIGIVRLFGILANVFYVTLFHGRINRKPLTSRRRTVVLFMINYIEIILWFAFFFLQMPLTNSTENVSLHVAALTFSVFNASGIGQSPLSASSTCALSISLIESGIGIFMIVAVLARFIGALPSMPQDQESDEFD